MKVSSPSFKNNEKIPGRFTADGENINPELEISDIPRDARTLVLIVDDPDAQRVCGFTWVHWVVFNIPANESRVIIRENSLPGSYGESTYKKPEYSGPNPPKGSGVHHYYFRAYALDKSLNLPEGASIKEIMLAMEKYVLDKAELAGIYSR